MDNIGHRYDNYTGAVSRQVYSVCRKDYKEMKFYAYIPNEREQEPIGTANRIIFELKTIRGAIRRAERILGIDTFCLFSYRNFFSNDTFNLIMEKGKLKPHNIYNNW